MGKYVPKEGGYTHIQLITEVQQNTDAIVAILERLSPAASGKAKDLINQALIAAYKTQRSTTAMIEIVTSN